MRLLVVVVGCLFFGACGDDGYYGPNRDAAINDSVDAPPPACLKLALTGAPTVAQPAKISLFLSVETCAGEPVPNVAIGEFQLREDGTLVSAFESNQLINRDAQDFRSYTLLVLDTSASIIESDSLPDMIADSVNFGNLMTSFGRQHYVGVYYFDGADDIIQVAPFTNDAGALQTQIPSVGTRQCTVQADCANVPKRKSCVSSMATGLCRDDSTNLYGAVINGLAVLTAAMNQSGVKYTVGNLVVLTDGTDQAALHTLAQATQAVNTSMHNIFTVGIGGETDPTVLQQLGKSGTASAANTSQLNATLMTIATKVQAAAERFYLLQYCSPKRNGTHQLRVTATHGGLTGSLDTMFSANGFTSGCTTTP